MPFKDPERKREYQKKYREEHRDLGSEAQRLWYVKHRDLVNERSKRWAKTHPQNILRQERRRKKIEWLLNFYGTDKLHCERCNYDGSFEALQFHHKNPEQKQSKLDSMYRWMSSSSMKDFQSKVMNTDFVILCANCHVELHAGLWTYGK